MSDHISTTAIIEDNDSLDIDQIIADDRSLVSQDLQIVCDNLGACLAQLFAQVGGESDNEVVTGIHQCLVLTDELHTVTEIIRSDSKVSVNTINTFHEKIPDFERLFGQIDKLETKVTQAREKLTALDASVTKAERELASRK